MTVRELMKVVAYDDVCLYHEVVPKEIEEVRFEDLYKGSNRQIPEELMGAPVKVVSAKKKDLLDIQIEI